MSNAPEAARYREVTRYYTGAPRGLGVKRTFRAPDASMRGRYSNRLDGRSGRTRKRPASWVRVVLRQLSSQSSRLKSTRTSRSSNTASPSNYRARGLRTLPSLPMGVCSSARLSQLEERPGRCSKSIRLTHRCNGPGGVATCTGGDVVGPNLVCAGASG